MPVWPWRSAWCLPQCRLAVLEAAQPAAVQPQPGWLLFLLKLVVAVGLMSGVLLAGMHYMPAWDQGICWSASCALGPDRGGCGDVFRLPVPVRFPPAAFRPQGAALRRKRVRRRFFTFHTLGALLPVVQRRVWL
jgi:hypothetical protein